MKTIKLIAGMPLGVKYITVDLGGTSNAWLRKPTFNKFHEAYMVRIDEGDFLARIHPIKALKPGEIVRVVP